MLELVSVNVENFRSFSTGEFVPLGIGQGMTAINGANGMGKSSIVHAAVWALFGITPDGVPVRALRRQGSEGEVVATVVIRHDGQTIEITRALRGRNDTTIASIKVDGVEQTNVSSKTATIWVQNRLNLDAEAFLTAFVVRQKELDSLVKARPADRRKTIERLAGIERMSAALDLARQDTRSASRLLEALPAAEDLSLIHI
jgi:exonuclease SbcC